MTPPLESSAYTAEEVWFPFSEAILSWDADFHALMLDDHIRMAAYKAAIEETVKPGAVVLDLGTGTGILALWALQAGAARVYGLDLSAEVLRAAVDRIGAAGFGERFQPIRALSYDTELPEPVDLVISEIMGNIGDNEDFVPILADARRRFLRPDGRMLPRRVETYLAPVAALGAHGQLRAGNCRGLAGATTLDSVLQRRGLTSRFDFYYDVILPRGTYLATPRLARQFAFDDRDESTYEFSTTFAVDRGGAFTGFKGYFVADLSDSVALDIAGDDIAERTTSDSWKHCYLPVERPIEVRRGDRINLHFSRSYPDRRDTPFRQAYRWRGQIRRGRELVAEFDQDMRPAAPTPP